MGRAHDAARELAHLLAVPPTPVPHGLVLHLSAASADRVAALLAELERFGALTHAVHAEALEEAAAVCRAEAETAPEPVARALGRVAERLTHERTAS
jgi:hypothetical protein